MSGFLLTVQKSLVIDKRQRSTKLMKNGVSQSDKRNEHRVK